MGSPPPPDQAGEDLNRIAAEQKRREDFEGAEAQHRGLEDIKRAKAEQKRQADQRQREDSEAERRRQEDTKQAEAEQKQKDFECAEAAEKQCEGFERTESQRRRQDIKRSGSVHPRQEKFEYPQRQHREYLKNPEVDRQRIPVVGSEVTSSTEPKNNPTHSKGHVGEWSLIDRLSGVPHLFY